MDNHEKEYFEGLLIRAVQAGKKETSGLVTDMKISLKEIDDRVHANFNQLTLLESRVSDVITLSEKMLEEDKKRNGRIDKLEKWRSWITGGMAMFMLFVPLIIYALTQ